MKRLILMILAICLLVAALCGQSQTQTQQPQPAQQTSALPAVNKLVSPEQLKALQDTLTSVQQTLGQSASADGHKTVGDVLDKGLDMFKDATVFVAAKIEQVAPQLWKVLLVQQYVNGLQILLPPIGFLLVIFFTRRIIIKWWPKAKDDEDPEAPVFEETHTSEEFPFFPTRKGWHGVFTVFLPVCCFVIGGIWLCISISGSAGYFLNPYYYALKDLVLLVRNPGAL